MLEEDDVVVDVDDGNGNGNDEMSTNRAEWKRRQSDIKRAGERSECVHYEMLCTRVSRHSVSIS